MMTPKASSSVCAVGTVALVLLSMRPIAGYGAGSGGGVGVGMAGVAAGPSGGGHSGGGGSHASGSASSTTAGGHAGASAGRVHGGMSGHETGFHPANPTVTGASHPLPSVSRPASAVTANRPVTSTQPAARGAARPTNAWTDTETNQRTVVDLHNRSAQAYRQYIANGNHVGLTTPEGSTGSFLYPGAYGSALNSYYNHLGPKGADPVDGHPRSFAHDDRWYGPNARYHRYWANGYATYLGGYLGYPYLGAYGVAYVGGINDGDSLLGNNGETGAASAVATTDVGNPTGADPAGPGNPDTQAVPANRSKTAENAEAALGSGPDSLIEAVQGELARLGYFRGKVDAVYRADTREALRRFQSDQGLKATGRVNEATLHALQLD